MQQTTHIGMPVSGQGAILAGRWLMLGVTALALAGIFALLLVVARTPGFEAFFPTQDFFRTALVVHVDQSVLIWFLAFSGVVWSLENRVGGVWRPMFQLALGITLAGCLLVAASPFLGADSPLMNNYVPVLRHPLFIGALAVFGVGIGMQVFLYLLTGWRDQRWSDPYWVGAYTSALAVLTALGSLGWTAINLSADWQGEAYYEYLFWGGGHAFQFAYTQLMLVAWLWLAAVSGIQLGVSRRVLAFIMVLGALPLLAVPVIHALYEVDSGFSRLAFTRLMQYGNGLAAIPIGLLLLAALFRNRPKPAAEHLPAYRALQASMLLFAAGGLIAWAISGVNTVIPAHYHGSIVGVTLALMGLSYALLPRLGYAVAEGRMARMQPWIYGAGQLLHIGGLAVSGAMGIQRKTAGAAQGLEGVYAKVAMGVMGIGGLLAVIGGILFVLVMLKAFFKGREAVVE